VLLRAAREIKKIAAVFRDTVSAAQEILGKARAKGLRR